MSKYEKSSETYDAVYLSKKDYVKEAEQVHGIVQEQRKSAGNELLDVACGTGLHAEAFQRWYQVEGLESRSACSCERTTPKRQVVPCRYDKL